MLSVILLLTAFACLLTALLTGIFECLFIALGFLTTSFMLYNDASTLSSILSGIGVTSVTLPLYIIWCRHQAKKPTQTIAPNCEFEGQHGVIREIDGNSVFIWVSGTLWEAEIEDAVPEAGMPITIIGTAPHNPLVLRCRKKLDS